MALVEKRIEFFQVEFKTENSFLFEDLVVCSEVVEIDQNIKGKQVTLKILENNSEIIIGLIETSRKNNIPPKKNSKIKKIDRLGLNTDEGLAYANIFLYEKKRKILMYEVNKSGCFVDHFLQYIYRCCKKSETYKSFDIKLTPVLKANEYKRMINMRFHKSLELKLAQPKKILEDYKHKNDAIYGLCKSGTDIGSTMIKAKFEVQMKDDTLGLSSKSLKSIVDNALELVRGPKGENVVKIQVEGYETDSEDNKLLPIDLIADRYLKFIKLNEPRENSNLLEIQRKSEIEKLYKKCLTDFYSIFGK